MKLFLILRLGLAIYLCYASTVLAQTKSSTKIDTQLLEVYKTDSPVNIDGVANEPIWQKAKWQPLDQLWLGSQFSKDDFSGRYKLTWAGDGLYLLAEITDDVLLDKEADPLVAWWDDDCLEIFVDEDNSGGNHQYTHNAFAYHVALDGNVVDMSPKQTGKLYNAHVISKRYTTGNTTTWEVKILLFDDSYTDEESNQPVTLKANKKIGFALAYCDNDTSANRENFIGSVAVDGDDKNRGWIDANIFGTLILMD